MRPSVATHAHVGTEMSAKLDRVAAATAEVTSLALINRDYFVSDLLFDPADEMIAWAAARRATGTRNGLQLT